MCILMNRQDLIIFALTKHVRFCAQLLQMVLGRQLGKILQDLLLMLTIIKITEQKIIYAENGAILHLSMVLLQIWWLLLKIVMGSHTTNVHSTLKLVNSYMHGWEGMKLCF